MNIFVNLKHIKTTYLDGHLPSAPSSSAAFLSTQSCAACRSFFALKVCASGLIKVCKRDFKCLYDCSSSFKLPLFIKVFMCVVNCCKLMLTYIQKLSKITPTRSVYISSYLMSELQLRTQRRSVAPEEISISKTFQQSRAISQTPIEHCW